MDWVRKIRALIAIGTQVLFHTPVNVLFHCGETNKPKPLLISDFLMCLGTKQIKEKKCNCSDNRLSNYANTIIVSLSMRRIVIIYSPRAQ